MTILPLPEHLLDEAYALSDACFSLPWSHEALAAERERTDACTLAAVENGHLSGLLTARIVLDECELYNIAVSPASRRCGMGAALLMALEECCAARSVTRILLEVRASNIPAIALYERAGFVLDGIRPGFYERPREDAMLYSKILPQGGSHDPACH